MRIYLIYGKQPDLYGDIEVMGGEFRGRIGGKRWERFVSALTVKGFTITRYVLLSL